uniref:RES family NAD+ phosphorylase n=1 Tax=uncultured Caulobacter sp. TaxID=158749 RepID=UPI0025F90441|nr:RES family NAD+ phosphorylase [uncultured Caulobacter sp.]
MNRYLVEVVVPDIVWDAAYAPAPLPVGWDADPASMTSITLGTHWLHAKTTALLVAPSVIAPEELNVVINPAHPDSAGITATKVRKWLYDPRLTK